MNRIPLFVALGLVLVVGCDSVTSFDDSSSPDRFDSSAQSPAGGISADIIEGHYIVVLSKQPAARDVAASNALEAVTDALDRRPGASVNRTYRHALTGFAAELTGEQVEELRRDPRVLAIEQDSYVYPADDGAVQAYPTWGLDRIDQREALLDRAYVYTATGRGVTAYIIDSGIRYSHEEFGGRASLGYDFVLDDDPDNTDPNQEPGDDCRGHGTHVAGTVGGSTFGVAKDVRLVSVRVFGCTGGTWRSTVLAAIDWVTANAALPAVANMSLGGHYDPEAISYRAAIENANEAGISHVVAAGNASEDACNWEPARTPEAITVGASVIGDARASFSNYGRCVDLYAPGASIVSAWINDSWGSDGSYTRPASGTSMAAPHVAGVVALFLEANPTASPAQVHSAILANATPDAVSDVPSGTTKLLYSLWRPVDFIPPQPSPLDVNFAASGLKVRGKQVIDLTWNPVNEWLEVTRDGLFLGYAGPGTDSFRDNTGSGGNDGTYIHQICETSELYLLPACSEKVTTIFGDGGGDDGGAPDPPPGDGPTASFNYSCGNSDTCQFADTSNEGGAAIVSQDWATGSQTASGSQASFTFGSAGDHVVTLTVADAHDEFDQASRTINCKSHPRHGLRCS
jgi:subtilisin family serine protease